MGRLIDADELLKRATEAERYGGWTASVVLVEDIEKMPTTDPVRRGKWVAIPLNGSDDRYGMNKYNKRIRCTACELVTTSEFSGCNYCPSCGAKMDKAVQNDPV